VDSQKPHVWHNDLVQKKTRLLNCCLIHELMTNAEMIVADPHRTESSGVIVIEKKRR
jgi:hypothetical protein